MTQIKRGTLHLRTIEMLKASEQSPLQIYAATGITPAWLAAFRQDKMKQPSVNRVQALYEFLTGQKILA